MSRGDAQSTADSDATLQQLLQRDDPDGLARLVAAHGGLVRGMLRKQFGRALDDSLLEDAFGQAMLRAWKSRRSFDPQQGTARSWFCAIAYRAALVILTAERRLPQVVVDLDRGGETVRQALERERQRKLVLDLHDCIDQLRGLQRLVLLADLAAGGHPVPANELATATGALAPSIYVARSRAIRTLRMKLEALGHRWVWHSEPVGSEENPAVAVQPRAEEA